MQTSTANGVYLNKCEAEIKNAKFKNNGYCGLEILNIDDKKSTFLENVEFSEHRIGSALYVSSNGKFTAKRCDFHDNKLDVKGKSNINSVIVFTTTAVPKVLGTGEKIVDRCVFIC